MSCPLTKNRPIPSLAPRLLRSLSAIRNASSPPEALSLYKATLLHSDNPTCSNVFYSHALVFALKSSSSLANSHLISHLHAHVEKTGLCSDAYVGTALLHGYTRCSLPDARHLFDEMPERSVVSSNAMISGYCRRGNVGKAREVFDAMRERDVATWSAMIGGYMGRHRLEQGFRLFRQFVIDGWRKPDQVMIVTVLLGCSGMGCMPLVGRSIHGYCERNGMDLNVQLGTGLVDMYAKNGCLKNASLLFSRVKERNVVTWSAMICGFALHGYAKEALALLEEMVKDGVMPNEVTFTGVLNACCHAGLVDEAKRMFSRMTVEFGIEPSIHHYGCMVDLLGKAGMLEEAYELIMTMRVEANAIVWTSLLAACKMHMNFDIAFRAVDRVLQLHVPYDDSGVYTLIADIYGLAGRWNDLLHIRKIVDKRKLVKRPGSSLIKPGESMLSVVES